MMIAHLVMGQSSGNDILYYGNSAYHDNTAYTNTNMIPTTPAVTWVSDSVVEMRVNALMNKEPDAMIAIFSINQIGQTAEEANRLINERYKGFRDEIQRLGINKDDIYLDMVYFVPMYEYEEDKKIFSTNYNEVPKGFQIQQNAHIKYTDPNLLTKMVMIASKYEIYDLAKVEYFVEDHASIFKDLRQKAIDYAAQETELFINNLGMGIDAANRIMSENERVAFPNDCYTSYQAHASTSLDARKGGKINSIEKPTTMFYDGVAYDDFEIVINPVTVRPAVQFMYSLEIRFFVKPIEDKNKYLIVTPDGEVKPLSID